VVPLEVVKQVDQEVTIDLDVDEEQTLTEWPVLTVDPEGTQVVDEEATTVKRNKRRVRNSIWKRVALDVVAEIGLVSDSASNRLVVSKVCRDVMKSTYTMRNKDIAMALGPCIEFYFSNVAGRQNGPQVRAVLEARGQLARPNWVVGEMLPLLKSLLGCKPRGTSE